MSEIKVGDRVRCVNDGENASDYLEYGKIYVVDRVVTYRDVPPHLKLISVEKYWCRDRFVKVEDAAEPVVQVPSEPAAVDTDRVRCTWWERNGFVYDEHEQRWVLPPATERAAREADTQAAWDRFAAAALQGLLAGDRYLETPVAESCDRAAEYADEIIGRRAASRAAREKGGA